MFAFSTLWRGVVPSARIPALLLGDGARPGRGLPPGTPATFRRIGVTTPHRGQTDRIELAVVSTVARDMNPRHEDCT